MWREATKGVALGGTVDTLALAADASDDPAAYVGMELRLTSGAGADQRAAIVGYDAATRVATVSPAWSRCPAPAPATPSRRRWPPAWPWPRTPAR